MQPALVLLFTSSFDLCTLPGSVLVELKKSYPGYDLKALVRNASHIDAVRAAGASKIIHIPTRDLAKIESISAEAEIVVNVATSDDDEFIGAVLRGMKKRFESGKGKGILLHTTGSGVFLDKTTDGSFNPKSKIQSVSGQVESFLEALIECLLIRMKRKMI